MQSAARGTGQGDVDLVGKGIALVPSNWVTCERRELQEATCVESPREFQVVEFPIGGRVALECRVVQARDPPK